MVTVLIAALALLAALCAWLAAGWWETHRELGEAIERADRAEEVAESLLRALADRDLLNTVDTCQRARGSKR